MSKKDTAIFYSGATDVTGGALAEALGISGDKKKPTGKKLVIGWGAKTKDDVTFPAGTKVLNHPNKIRDNRNKFRTLQLLKKAGVSVAEFVSADNIAAELKKKSPSVSYPLVGRTNYHQGGKGFWLCLSMGQVNQALKEGAQYFQSYIPIADEYRLHVFGTDVIYAQKKVIRDNMNEAFTAQHAEKIKNLAAKNDRNLDEDTLKYALDQVGGRVLPNADMVIRSNMRGWKFSSIKLVNIKKDLADLAVAAVKAIGLDFGAVDCCVSEDGKAYIIEINSGPGLEKTAFDKYIDAFEKAIADSFETKKVVGTQKKAVEAAPVAKAAGTGSVKEELKSKAAIFAEMVEAADENEAAALKSVFSKMFK